MGLRPATIKKATEYNAARPGSTNVQPASLATLHHFLVQISVHNPLVDHNIVVHMMWPMKLVMH